MAQEPKITAELKIVLKANDMDIAESSDPILWQKVLAAINMPRQGSAEVISRELGENEENSLSSENGHLDRLAREFGVPVEVLKGSCSPTDKAPFIHLDKHHWEAMKKATPARGSKAIAPIALAATLLVFWKEKAKLGDSTIKEAQKILHTVGMFDKHAQRSIDNCEWLQMRNKAIVINPAQTSKAIKLARAYCTKEWDI